MNIQIDLFVNHEDPEILSRLTDLLDGAHLDKTSLEKFADQFQSGNKQIVNDLFKQDHVSTFTTEAGYDDEGEYRVFHFRQGNWGDVHMVHFINFLYRLLPGIHAQAWGFAEEEDPWEFFIKYENGRVIKQEHVPWEDEHLDEAAKEYIYQWWHEDMPEEIEVGLLNQEEDDDEDEAWDDDDDDE